MSNSLKPTAQAKKEQTVREAATQSDNDAQAILDYLQRVNDVKPVKPKGGAEKPTKWVGKVEPVAANIPAMQAFLQTCYSLKGMCSMIKALNKMVIEGNGSFTFDDVAAVEKFDRKVVVAQYLADHGKELKAPDNPRMGHAWGYALIGAKPFSDCGSGQNIKGFVSKHCDENGKCAFFKVS